MVNLNSIVPRLSPQLLPQRCTWLYVMNNVLMSVSGKKSLLMSNENPAWVLYMLPAALRPYPSCREVLPAVFPQSGGSVWTERTRAEETQQSVAQHQPLHWEDQLQVGQQVRLWTRFNCVILDITTGWHQSKIFLNLFVFLLNCVFCLNPQKVCHICEDPRH